MKKCDCESEFSFLMSGYLILDIFSIHLVLYFRLGPAHVQFGPWTDLERKASIMTKMVEPANIR